MSEAWLIPREKDENGRLVCYVRNNGCTGAPVDPSRLLPGRRWGSPRLVNGELRFEYRSLADEISSFALERLSSGRRLTRSSLDRDIARWLEGACESLAEIETDTAEEDFLDESKVRARALEMVAKSSAWVFNIDSPLHAHGSTCEEGGTDEEFRIASDALDLPRWAVREIFCEGGMGGGYYQAAVVLKEGRTFTELASWLIDRAQRHQVSSSGSF